MMKWMSILVISTGILLLSSFTTNQSLKESIKRGKEVYALYCQSCHMEDGKGTPGINPPLAKADYIKKPAKTLIGIILKGQTGDITVNGQKYNAIMPPQDYLTDIQIADVLNYVRNTWGNTNAVAITAPLVKAQRK